MAKEKWIDKHKNETRLNSAGFKMTIINGTSTDLTVKFENGYIAKHKQYGSFRNGQIEHPRGNWLMHHINETRTNKAGIKMTIIDGTYENLTIIFEDGSIVKHQRYVSFQKGYIKHPRGNWLMQHINETHLNKIGLEMTIIDGTAKNLTIKFKDGSIVKHKRYDEFKNGAIAYPKGNWYAQHINETNYNNSNFKMTITDIKNQNDITITFEDGSIVKHKKYDHFKKGIIAHPNGNWTSHLNETKKNTFGLKMTITDGTSLTDLTITFEDGSIIKHQTYSVFKKGKIAHPKGNWIAMHMNKSKPNNTGINMTITNGTNNDLTIKFEDGSIVKHRKNSSFIAGSLCHPLYPNSNKCNNKNDAEIGCITRKNLAYKTDTCHYYCTCNICQQDNIWNWKEIHEHNALHGIPKEDLIFIEPGETKDEKQSNPNKKSQS